jgi:hypothetical protein
VPAERAGHDIEIRAGRMAARRGARAALPRYPASGHEAVGEDARPAEACRTGRRHRGALRVRGEPRRGMGYSPARALFLLRDRLRRQGTAQEGRADSRSRDRGFPPHGRVRVVVREGRLRAAGHPARRGRRVHGARRHHGRKARTSTSRRAPHWPPACPWRCCAKGRLAAPPSCSATSRCTTRSPAGDGGSGSPRRAGCPAGS